MRVYEEPAYGHVGMHASGLDLHVNFERNVPALYVSLNRFNYLSLKQQTDLTCLR